MSQYLKGSEEFVNRILEKQLNTSIAYNVKFYKELFMTQQNLFSLCFFDGFYSNPKKEFKHHKSVIGVWRIKLK